MTWDIKSKPKDKSIIAFNVISRTRTVREQLSSELLLMDLYKEKSVTIITNG